MLSVYVLQNETIYVCGFLLCVCVCTFVAAGRCWQDRSSVSQSPTRTRSSLPSTNRGRMACCVTSPWLPGSRSSTLTRLSWQRAATTLGWVLSILLCFTNGHRMIRWLITCIPSVVFFFLHIARFDWRKGFVQAYISIKSRYQSGSVVRCWYDGGDNVLRNRLKGLVDCHKPVLHCPGH